MATKGKGGESWGRQARIVEHVRFRIVSGEWGPGERVPTRDELERRFRASRVTIQRAFDVLIREGFVEPRGRAGTFVSPTPPHLFRYLLVFPLSGSSPGLRSSLQRALLGEARAVTAGGSRELVVFEGLVTPGDVARLHALDEDIRCRRMGGVIFVGDPMAYEGTAFLAQQGLPRVALCGAGTSASVPRIELDRRPFFSDALALLAARHGRKRVALLASGAGGEEAGRAFQGALRLTGQATRPHWQHRVEVGQGEACRNLTALLMQGAVRERPDALVLTEELLGQDVLAGLRDAGVDPVRDITMVAMTYTDTGPVYRDPVWYLGYDLRRVLDTCFRLLGVQRGSGGRR